MGNDVSSRRGDSNKGKSSSNSDELRKRKEADKKATEDLK
jgi:hypothetical protein